MKFQTLALILLTLSFLMIGCSSSSSGSKPETSTISPTSADLFGGQAVLFTSNISTDPNQLTWSVNGTVGGSSTVGIIDATGNYTAPAAPPPNPITVTVASAATPSESATAAVTVVGSGLVTPTANLQVALYTLTPPAGSTVAVQFGTDTAYGLTTSAQPASATGAPLGILVAGMKASTLYHLRAVVQLPDSTTLDDSDHTFTTGTLPVNQLPGLTAATSGGMTPQPGIEMLDLIGAGIAPVIATDLSGNIIWYYKPGGSAADIVQPVKPLPNGHFLLVISPNSAAPLSGTPEAPATITVLREIDLAGTTINELSLATLNTRLAAAGFNYTALDMHHDVAILPNGHLIIIVNSTQQLAVTGTPDLTTVLGDALIDLDATLTPVWMWDSFGHLDVNRHPMSFPDWTHANAILYSPTDGNLLLSMRHQNWILKIDYADGKGAGDIIWHLGEGGEFSLQGGTNPTDWFYAQHGPSFSTQTTAGTFGLTVFDNGDDRMFPPGVTCASLNPPSCPYSTVEDFTINEAAKTATLNFHDISSLYSSFGGNAEVLANNNVEYDLCQLPGTLLAASVNEVTPTAPAQLVWNLGITKANAYRAFRIPSLYPGVTW